eukprot:365738-Chlamydomonas_euryale.AAC.32
MPGARHAFSVLPSSRSRHVDRSSAAVAVICARRPRHDDRSSAAVAVSRTSMRQRTLALDACMKAEAVGSQLGAHPRCTCVHIAARVPRSPHSARTFIPRGRRTRRIDMLTPFAALQAPAPVKR